MIFDKLALNGNRYLKNRLAVAPMTTQQSHPDGSVSQAEADWLVRLSMDGYGMVISCAAAISPDSTAFYNQLSLADDSCIPALQKVAGEMKQSGSLNIIQLCHGGSRTIASLTGRHPSSASSYHLEIPGFTPPTALTVEEIDRIKTDFSLACRKAQQAGFDGVELHGANGYLFTQFISKMTNLRNDEYGGTLEGRARFSREVVRACRKMVADDFIIGFRLSFENMGMETGLDIDENIRVANLLADDGVDYIHSSQMQHDSRSVKYPDKTLISHVRSGLSARIPLVVAGSIWSAADAEQAISSGADIVAIGRAAIGNRQVPAYFKEDMALPAHTPFQVEDLKRIGISDAFIDYCKNAPPLRSLNIVK